MHFTIATDPALPLGLELVNQKKARWTYTTPILMAIKMPTFSFCLNKVPYRKVHGRAARRKSMAAD